MLKSLRYLSVFIFSGYVYNDNNNNEDNSNRRGKKDKKKGEIK